MPGTHHYDKYDWASKTPDERFMDGDPAEVGVPVSLRVQTNSKAFGQRKGKTEEMCSYVCRKDG